MSGTKVTFRNAQGESLSGLLEVPTGVVKSYALFAHCFTCSKNNTAASRITRALALKGIAVLRFDFTGLGNSEGDFSNTNFSSNLQDLISAAKFLAEQYAAPAILIGHSLGGAAVLAVAQHVSTINAVITIGAPATAAHIKHFFVDSHDEILHNHTAKVELGGRSFTIRRQLIDDLENYNSLDHIKTLRKALLIFHSPRDETVSISEAARIFVAAKHPKSFVSLDQADHLLSQPEDAQYVADVLAAWASRYLAINTMHDQPMERAAPLVKPGHVIVREYDKVFTRKIFTEHHQFISDEPVSMGGADLGVNPYELLLAALGSCTSMTLRMYANHKKIDLQAIEVELMHHRIHADDCESCEKQGGCIDKITRIIRLTGSLDDKQRVRLLEIADKCPVHKTLDNQLHIVTQADYL
ncbi:putative redox protein [Nitrosomonas cryotolerans]|uniref:Putative redox protein n=1 Tax=Nitrosomonas cryotolerans ATCC 49181 TaxID=1131553 RepID=A0A1N6JE73_9PROT|nr:bifunctional alpha/beta hydrolase/OsmC family protein [Nitrosomonas cryotolerans]SFP49821.1 putative redox protein [Nitrosomonas cryotolerans]SIO42527.1 putative redox protein [Nitrosomonas cryotolerans ATCC 49181]